MQVFIRPVDTQFHRSGLPFDAGQDTEVSSLFPPFSRTLYGALRAKGISSSEGMLDIGDGFDAGKVTDVFGNRDRFGKLLIKGPLLGFWNDVKAGVDYNLFFPLPLDLVAERESLRRSLLSPTSGILLAGCDRKSPDFSFVDRRDISEPMKGEKVKSQSGEYYLAYNDLRRYLTHSISDEKADTYKESASSKLFVQENRVGIARDVTTRTAKESMLYTTQHFRMVDTGSGAYGLYVTIEGHRGTFPDKGFLQIGGDFRAASYVKLAHEDSKDWWELYKDLIVQKIVQNGCFKVFFITPAIFKEGALPDKREAGGHQCVRISVPCSSREPVSFYLKAACIGKPKSIGGWDIQRRGPKAMRKAVPEGSVYFFEADQAAWQALDEKRKEEAASGLFANYNFKSWCSEEPWSDEYGDEYGPAKEGFGIALIGGW